jgi:hypothetical protein
MRVKDVTYETYRKSDIQAVIHNDFGLILPDVVDEVHHNPDGLIPY